MFSTYKGGPATSPIGGGQAQGATSAVNAPGGWHPTILYLAALVAAEVIAAGFLIRLVK